LVILIFQSCKEDKLDVFNSVDRIHFEYVTEAKSNVIDSAVYNFSSYKGADQIAMPVVMQIMGKISDEDRPVEYELDAASTAVMGEDVILPPAKIRAHRTRDTLWVVVKKTDKLLDNMIKAVIRLKENEYFKTDLINSIHGDSIGNRKIDGTRFTFFVQNSTSMPNLWADYSVAFNSMFGSYSNVKYQLMMDVCGFGPDMFTYDANEEKARDAFGRKNIAGLAFTWIRMMNAYLIKYEREHEGKRPLDEFGKEVKMPSSYL
jgi:hypothetical protein